MKIKEVIAEVSGYEKGKDAMDKLLTPSRWDLGPSYEKGKDTMDKILTPRRWFGSTQSAKQQTTSKVQPYQIKQSLINAGSEKSLYHDDIAALKSAYNDTDDSETQKAIKMAYEMKPLSKEQKALLIAQSKKY